MSHPQFYVYTRRGQSGDWKDARGRWLGASEFLTLLQGLGPKRIDRVVYDRPRPTNIPQPKYRRANIQAYQTHWTWPTEAVHHRVGYQNRIPRVVDPRWSRDYTDLWVYAYGGADYGAIE